MLAVRFTYGENHKIMTTEILAKYPVTICENNWENDTSSWFFEVILSHFLVLLTDLDMCRWLRVTSVVVIHSTTNAIPNRCLYLFFPKEHYWLLYLNIFIFIYIICV